MRPRPRATCRSACRGWSTGTSRWLSRPGRRRRPGSSPSWPTRDRPGRRGAGHRGRAGQPCPGCGRSERPGVGPRLPPRPGRSGGVDEGVRLVLRRGHRRPGGAGVPGRRSAGRRRPPAHRVPHPHPGDGRPAGRAQRGAHPFRRRHRLRRARAPAAGAVPRRRRVRRARRPAVHPHRQPDPHPRARRRPRRLHRHRRRLPGPAARAGDRRPRPGHRGDACRAAGPGLPGPADRDGGRPAPPVVGHPGAGGEAQRGVAARPAARRLRPSRPARCPHPPGGGPMTERSQVVIVGGGPVGVGLAVDLGQRGVSSVVLERRTALSSIPKGQGLSQRTMELAWTWGVADQLRAARTMPPGHAIGQVTVYGDLMGEFWHAPPGRELVQPFYAQANERLPQYRTEEVLRRRLADLPSVRTRMGWRATNVESGAEGVRVVAEADGVQEVFEADYVVGCDGGHSLVREQADIARTGTDFGELVALVVFRSRELHEALKRFPDRSTYRVMHPDLKGYWMFFGRVDVGEEFFFHAPVPPGTTAGSLDAAELLHRAAGFSFDCTIEHVGFWDLRVQVATAYRAGRALIAGDAAHTHPPYGGVGPHHGPGGAPDPGWEAGAGGGGGGGGAR